MGAARTAARGRALVTPAADGSPHRDSMHTDHGYLALSSGSLLRARPDSLREIEDVVERGEVDAGLLIHEGQLTFQDRGLHLLADMGEWWFQETGLPLPLGGNVIRKDLGSALIATISRHLHASIAYGLEHRTNALQHAMQYARGLDLQRADTFVGMYVNEWTLDYGERGRAGVRSCSTRGTSGHHSALRAVEFVGDDV